MTRAELQKARLSVKDFDKGYQLALNLIENLSSTCLNCGYWRSNPADELQYVCGQNNQIPPPRVIVNGCDNHTALIPF